MTIGCAMAIVFLSISAYFCIRKKTPRNFTNSGPHISQAQSQPPNLAPSAAQQGHSTKTYSVEYATNNGNITIRESGIRESGIRESGIRESGLPSTKPNPDLVMSSLENGDVGGFEIEGDKTKFATLQRQRKTFYDDVRDSSKNRVQSLRRNLLSPSQFEGSAEKLLINEMIESSPQHHVYGMQMNQMSQVSQMSQMNQGTSSGCSSPVSTPTPPPYHRHRMTSSPVRGSPMMPPGQQVNFKIF